MVQATTSKNRDTLAAQFSELGVAIVEYALTPADLSQMDTLFPELGERIPGARTEAFSAQARDWLANHRCLQAIANQLTRTDMRLSRLQAFDKSPQANWFVPWHQDRAEDGRERSVAKLERTLVLRIHLDDCSEDDGPLEVLPNTHTLARLDAAGISQQVANKSPLLCLASRGDIVAIRPLLLHRSQRARRPSARRVIHLEYTANVALHA